MHKSKGYLKYKQRTKIMKNYKIIYALVLSISLLSCRRADSLVEENCSSGERGSVSFNVSNGESYEMLINEKSFFQINQTTHPTEGTAVFITGGWYPDMTNTNIYGFSGQLMGAITTGTSFYDSSEEVESGGLIFTHFENEVGFSYTSTELSLTVNQANLCLGGVFCPIEATFSGIFIKTNFPSEVTDTLTVNGSFCLYKIL